MHNFRPSDEFHEIKLEDSNENRFKYNQGSLDDIEKQDHMYYKENSTTQYPPGRSWDSTTNKGYNRGDHTIAENDQTKHMFMNYVNNDIFANPDEQAPKSINIDVLDELDFDKKDKNEEYIPIEVNRKYCTVCNLEQPIRTKHWRTWK